MGDFLSKEEANYCIVGCGLPGRGMGWYHGLQLVSGEVAGARLSDVVEPWFLGGGKDSPPGKEFQKLVGEWGAKGVAFHAAVDGGSVFANATAGPKIALIAGRTPDNPKFFRQALAAGAPHILLEKPGAPTVGELEEMAALAREKQVPVFMGFIKNISSYLEGALAAAARAPAGADLETMLVSRNDYTRETLAECFSRNSEGMLKNMLIHELALACQFFGMKASNITSVEPHAAGCEVLTLGEFTDFAKVDVTLTNAEGTKVRVSADRCSGDGCCAKVTDLASGTTLYEAEMVDAERAKTVAAAAAAHPDWFSYLYTQAVEYQKLKGVCAAHAIAKTAPPGVSTIEVAIEALKLAEYLTPVLKEKLAK
mmetsp:Transcript_4423/g.13074  ORF Transcript_4423/g.13074 Transcript_4423/m.13074 type:complete len:368 (+) Transcript_4423:137-1240(+)